MKKLLALTFALAVFVPFGASAQYVDRDDSARFEEDFDDDEFVIAARSRAIIVPGFALNWFLEEHENHWSKGQKNFAFGGEAMWRRAGEYEIGVAVDWANLSMPAGWWQDRNEPRNEADWTEVDLKLVSVVFISRWFWDVQEWLSPFVGVSIGPGIVLGAVTKYNPAAGSDCRAALNADVFPPDDACLDEDGNPQLQTDFEPGERETAIPPIVPVLGVTGGLRFNFATHGLFKIEVGFQDYFFAGLGLGVQW